MKPKTSTRIALPIALCAGLLTSTAQAEVYLGAGGGVVVYDVQGIDSAPVGRVTLGYRNHTPFFTEATGYFSGRSDIDGTSDRLQTLGGGMSLGLRAPLDRKGSGLFIKGGYYLATARAYVGAGGNKPYIRDKGDGVSYGLGAEWFFTPYIGLRTDVEVYDNLDLFGSTANASFITLSLLAAFGGGDYVQPATVSSSQPVYRSYTPTTDVRTAEPTRRESYELETVPRNRGVYTPTVPYSSTVEDPVYVQPDAYVSPAYSGYYEPAY